MGVRPVFAVVEIAEILGMSRQATHRFLRAHQIPVDRSNVHQHRVWLADLQLAAPRVWDSLVLAAASGGVDLTRTPQKPPTRQLVMFEEAR